MKSRNVKLSKYKHTRLLKCRTIHIHKNRKRSYFYMLQQTNNIKEER